MSSDLLSEKAQFDLGIALERLRKEIELKAPVECVVLSFWGSVGSAVHDAAVLKLPKVWIYDFTEMCHRPSNEPLDTEGFRVVRVRLSTLEVQHHMVMGPIPKCPI